MKLFFCVLLVTFVVSANGFPKRHRNTRGGSLSYRFITKEEWGAQPVSRVSSLETPVPLVVIHHTYIPGFCNSTEACSSSMRSMQNTHMNTNGWTDIGYNFAIGGDGAVYEGRGWTAVGAHAAGVNTMSIGIVLIGDWVADVPPSYMLELVPKVIKTGVDAGYISCDYRLIGHRQATSTECPGEALFSEIKNWSHFYDGAV